MAGCVTLKQQSRDDGAGEYKSSISICSSHELSLHSIPLS